MLTLVTLLPLREATLEESKKDCVGRKESSREVCTRHGFSTTVMAGCACEGAQPARQKKKKMDSEPPPFGEHDHTEQAQCTPFAAASPPALLATCTSNIRLANEQRNDNALLPKRRNERDASHHRRSRHSATATRLESDAPMQMKPRMPDRHINSPH